jgi:peptidoglycan/LPS O-acetylase OafA/YrhL
LIGGILFNTRNREGYFSVFYARRIVRVFPVYYLVLLIIAGFCAYRGFPLDYHFWSHFAFIHNLFPDYVKHDSPVVMIHYWSLAVEEQFYLLWPLVVWMFPQRRKLIAIASFLILVIFGIRFASPHFFVAANQLRYFSPMRADAILIGVVLSLIQHKALFERMKRMAKWVAWPGMGAAVLWAFWKCESWPKSFHGEQIAIPWFNFTAAALVLVVMEEKSWLSRFCSQRWICWLGRRSYSLYIVHFLYFRWFFQSVVPYLSRFMPHLSAILISNLLAFSLTLLLATLSYQLIEVPTQRLKQRLKYGERRETSSTRRLGEEALA